MTQTLVPLRIFSINVLSRESVRACFVADLRGPMQSQRAVCVVASSSAFEPRQLHAPMTRLNSRFDELINSRLARVKKWTAKA
jgi:hypothetical protein